MGKVANVLIAGYWPDRVPRRIGVPQVPIPKLLDRAASRSADAPALVASGGSLTHAMLHEEAARYGAALVDAVPPNGVVGILEPSLERALVLTVAGLLAGCKVAILDAARPDLVSQWAASAPMNLLVASDQVRSLVDFDGPVTSPADLLATGAGGGSGRRPARWREVAVRLPSGPGLVGHTHVGVSAMVTDLTTFIPALGELDFAHAGPLSRWDGLAGSMTALLSGRAVVVGGETLPGWDPRSSYSILTRDAAQRIVSEGAAPEHLSELGLLFVEVTDFTVKWRRQLEDVLDRIVLPIWGSAEVGPAVAAHPTWAPLEIHGLPLVNVTMVPLDPTTREPSEVPWEMLTRAELGIESPSVIVEAGSPELAADLISVRGNPVVRTGRIVSVDRLGLVRFHDD